jgi:uncharacterized protein YcfL
MYSVYWYKYRFLELRIAPRIDPVKLREHDGMVIQSASSNALVNTCAWCSSIHNSLVHR